MSDGIEAVVPGKDVTAWVKTAELSASASTFGVVWKPSRPVQETASARSASMVIRRTFVGCGPATTSGSGAQPKIAGNPRRTTARNRFRMRRR